MNDNFKEILLEKLKSAKIKMHSRWYFIGKNILLIVLIGAMSIIILFIDSFIFFALDKSALWYLPGFGLRGLIIMFNNLPWFLIGLVVALLLILEYLITRYSFAYHRPLIYSALVLLVLVTTVSIGVKATSFHENIDKKVEEGKMPMAKSFYREIGLPKPKEFNPGMIINISQNEFQIQQPDGCNMMVEFSEKTRLPRNFYLNNGDYVLIIGQTNNCMLQAEAIRRAPQKLFPSPTAQSQTVSHCLCNEMK